jgi:hypothetical protein
MQACGINSVIPAAKRLTQQRWTALKDGSLIAAVGSTELALEAVTGPAQRVLL